LVVSLLMMVIVTESVKLEKVELAIHEGSADFKETIFVDSSGKYGIIKVPQHNNLTAVEIFLDYQKGYRIEKIVNEKICTVMKLDKSKDNPMDLLNGVKRVHNKFPTAMYTVVRKSTLTTGKVDLKSPIGKTAALFCGTGMDIQHAVSYVGEDLNEFVTQQFRTDAEKKNQKRSTIGLRKDYRCCRSGCSKTKAEGMSEILNRCNGEIGKVKASCRVGAFSCAFRVNCPSINGLWTCTSIHDFDTVVCCDFSCNI